ncbi:MAG: RDD family protein [Anaerolineae bacterium]
MTSQTIPPYADLWARFRALVVDVLLFCALFFPVTRVVKGVWLMSATDHRWANGLFITDPLCLTFLALMLLYFVLLEGLVGATLGKWALGLRVISADGGRPGLGRSAARNLLRLVDGLPAFNILGIVLILRSPENARFGDRVAGTRVIRFNHTRR